jgi:hypothetical protein
VVSDAEHKSFSILGGKEGPKKVKMDSLVELCDMAQVGVEAQP